MGYGGDTTSDLLTFAGAFFGGDGFGFGFGGGRGFFRLSRGERVDRSRATTGDDDKVFHRRG